MSKMTVIQLLNKIANGEEVPKEICYKDYEYTYNAYTGDYDRYIGTSLFTNLFSKERTNCFINDEVEVTEDKKIEKLKIEQDTPNSNFYIRNENGTKCGLTKHSKIIADKINEIIDKINKGE